MSKIFKVQQHQRNYSHTPSLKLRQTRQKDGSSSSLLTKTQSSFKDIRHRNERGDEVNLFSRLFSKTNESNMYKNEIGHDTNSNNYGSLYNKNDSHSRLSHTNSNISQTTNGRYSLPLNYSRFENLVDNINNCSYRDMNNIENVNNTIIQLNKSIENISHQMMLCANEQENTEKNIIDLEKQNRELMMDVERAQRENFHNSIEIIYTNKKIKELKEKIQELDKASRSFKYEQNKLMNYSNKFGIGLKVDSNRIRILQEEKKNLRTSIVLFNKKLNKLKKEVALNCFKGEMALDQFGKLVEGVKGKRK